MMNANVVELLFLSAHFAKNLNSFFFFSSQPGNVLSGGVENVQRCFPQAFGSL